MTSKRIDPLTPCSLNVGVDAYLAHLTQERRLAPRPATAYRRDLDLLLLFCSDNKIDDWNKIDAHRVRSFVSDQHRRGLSGRSVQRLLSALRGLFNYLLREGQLDANPAVSVSAPRDARNLPKDLDPERVGRLLDTTPSDALETRDLAMLELFYSSGLRLSELVSIDLADLELEDRTVLVTGKGNKSRILPVGDKARQALARWLRTRPTMARLDEVALFVGRGGRRLNARSVQQRLRRWALKAGLDTHVHPHMLRHAFASHLLQASGDLRSVQELLGHADISTTQIYTHLDFQHLARVYDDAHPRARKQRGDDD